MPHAKHAGASARAETRRKRAEPASLKPAPLARKRTPPPREADPLAKTTGRRRTYYTGEFLAEAKRRIENTAQATTSLAADLGMHHSVLSRLITREGWVRPEASLRRRGLTPLMRLAAAADELVGASAQTAPHPDLLPASGERGHTALGAPSSPDNIGASDTSTIDRLEAAVLKELSVVETMRASLGGEPLRPMDAERTARTLSVLTETLAKLRRLRLGAMPQSGSLDHDDYPADIDEFRREFARRVELFVASRADGAGAGEAGPAGGSHTG